MLLYSGVRDVIRDRAIEEMRRRNEEDKVI